MNWSSWSRKPANDDPRTIIGLDLNAARARAVYGSSVGVAPKRLPLDTPDDDLALAISLEKRAPEIGRSGIALQRRIPHLVCSDFLPSVGQTREWKAGRNRLDATGATGIVIEKLKSAFNGNHVLSVLLPSYLAPTQITRLLEMFSHAKLPVVGSASVPLALAATNDEGQWGTALVVDVDSHALTWAILTSDG